MELEPQFGHTVIIFIASFNNINILIGKVNIEVSNIEEGYCYNASGGSSLTEYVKATFAVLSAY